MSALQEQGERAAQIRPILERTFALAQSWGLVEQAGDNLQYQGQEHTLIYNPQSDQFSMVNQDGSCQLSWHEQLFLAKSSQEITDQQFREFQELGQWLDTQQVPQFAASEVEVPNSTARLFEQYASQGESTFKLAAESTEDFYRVQVDNIVYLISQDAETGDYDLKREDGIALTTADLNAWASVDLWLDELDERSLIPGSSKTSDWESQTQLADSLLSSAEFILAFRHDFEAIEYDQVQQSYIIGLDDYSIGYSPTEDTLWVQRGTEQLASTSHQYLDEDSQTLTHLYDVGSITPTDIYRFQEWTTWLRLKQDELLQQQSIEEFDLTEKNRLDHDFER
ncbi:MAG: hypothetical protein DCF22_21300 [Leptolyngbya sp.]|nr:MAG: hypothetical protein DCF22_21300 [Leptolyngbya sp.]